MTVDLPGSTSSDGFSPRVILAYELNDDVLLTAQVARGFRLGGINDPMNVPLCYAAGHPGTLRQPEHLGRREGARTTSWARRRSSPTVASRSTPRCSTRDIDDLQVIADAGSCSSRIVFNVPKARSRSASKLELFARPNDNWDFGMSATWVQAEIAEPQ